MAIGTVGVASASAETGGHFTFEAAHTVLLESKEANHSFEFKFDNSNEPIKCTQSIAESTVNSATLTELKLTPSYSECKTPNGTASPVASNGCSLILTIGKNANSDNTVDLSCPSEKSVHGSHPNCTVTIPTQAGGLGAAYTERVSNGKRALTVDLTVKMTAYYHSGICIFLGTVHNWTLAGSFNLGGWNTLGEPSAIRATGSENAEFKTETAHTAVTGLSSSTMTFGALLGAVECSTVSLDGTTTVTEYTELTINPAYSGCKASGREVTTHTNGCAYILNLTGTGADGRVDIECPTGKSIETTIDKFPGGCTITIPAQTAGGVVDYKEEGAGTGRDLLLTWTLEGIHYTRDGCEVGGTGTNGTMGGSITLSGEDTSGNPKGVWIE